MLKILQAKFKKNAVELTLASDVIEKEDFKGSVSFFFILMSYSK